MEKMYVWVVSCHMSSLTLFLLLFGGFRIRPHIFLFSSWQMLDLKLIPSTTEQQKSIAVHTGFLGIKESVTQASVEAPSHCDLQYSIYTSANQQCL